MVIDNIIFVMVLIKFIILFENSEIYLFKCFDVFFEILFRFVLVDWRFCLIYWLFERLVIVCWMLCVSSGILLIRWLIWFFRGGIIDEIIMVNVLIIIMYKIRMEIICFIFFCFKKLISGLNK